MLTRLLFAVVAIGAPVALWVKIDRQRRALGRSPVVLGRTGGLEGLLERVSPLGLVFWPIAWLWIAFGAPPLSGGFWRAVGVLLVTAGALLTVSSIFLMGRAWRIGIDPENRTDLAENGPYRWIRHPIYSGMLLLVLGTVLVAPHGVIEIWALVTAVGIALQARREERHLIATFGERYARYAARTGRFMPRLRA